MSIKNILKIVMYGMLLMYQACSISSKVEKSDNFMPSEPRVRVRIINTLDTVQIRFSDEWIANENSQIPQKFTIGEEISIMTADQQIYINRKGTLEILRFDSLYLKSLKNTGELKIKNVPYGIGWWWAGVEDRTYEGEISVYPSDSGKPEVIVSLPLEDYLCGVVPYEIGGDSPPEALKAQAVAARSEAIIALTSNLYKGKHHDLTSDVECQVFSGNNKRTSASDKAVHETRGLILTNDGKPINAYYASNCGGYSELIENVWPDRPSPETYHHAGKDRKERPFQDLSTEKNAREWIFSHPDVFCNPHLNISLPNWSKKNFRWQKNFNRGTLTQMISGDKDLGQILGIRALKRGKSGRMYQARFIFEKDSLDIVGELAIRQMWHPALRSACFVVDQDGDNFILNGAGWGHGVGMCQSGAVAQAIDGSGFISILEHYYQYSEIVSIYQ